MTDQNTYTAEHRSWQWELVMQFEEGTLPAAQWNEATLGVIAVWYAQQLTPELAAERYVKYYERTKHRLTHRLGSAAVNTEAVEAVDKVWESLLTRALETKR